MPRRQDDGFMAALDHPLKAGIEQLRAAILASDDGISESVKWNAPNFRFDDPTGLLEWAAPDRAVLAFTDLGPVQGTAPSVRGVGRTGSFR